MSRNRTAFAAALALTPDEEEFFRVGDAMAESTDFRDLDDELEQPTLWRTMVDWLRGDLPQVAE